MVSEDEVEVKDNDNNLIGKLKFKYYSNSDAPTLIYTGTEALNSDNFKATLDLADLEGAFKFESAGTQITKITYKLPSKYKEKQSEIEIAKLFSHQEEPEP